MAFLLVSILGRISSESGQALDFEGDENSQLLIDAVIAEVGPGTQVSDFPTTRPSNLISSPFLPRGAGIG